MLNVNTITKTMIVAVALTMLAPNLAMAESMQIDSALQVYEKDSRGKVRVKELVVHLGDDGNLVLHRQDRFRAITYLLRPSAVSELETLFAKGADWAATAKEKKVDIQKEIGSIRYNQNNNLTVSFVSMEEGSVHYIILDIEMLYQTATFFLEPAIPGEIMKRINKAPEVKAELDAAIAAKNQKDQLFN